MNAEAATANTAWWRWPLVPIASLLAAAVGAIALSTIQGIAVGLQDDYSKTGWFHLFIYPVIPSAIFGYLLPGVAFHVAPTAKLQAATAMTTFMGFVLVAFTTFCWVAGVPAGDAIQTTMGSLAAIAAAIVALLHSRRDS